jgi:hypothetical protein
MSGATVTQAGPWPVSVSLLLMGAVVWVPLLLAFAQRAGVVALF